MIRVGAEGAEMANADAQKAPPDLNEKVVSLKLANGESLSLTRGEYRLALVGLVDFAGDWQALEIAARWAVDGAAKAALIRSRLLPLAEHLGALLDRKLDGVELLTVRHWFRNGPIS
jgi:hypothetical protein